LAPEPRVEARPRRRLYPVVLIVLQEENSYGYQIMQRTEQELGLEQTNPGAIYRTLRQMEKEGLCISEWDTSSDGLPRRVYFITEDGEAYLDAWVEAGKEYSRLMEALLQAYKSKKPRTS
jgi:PadR family transcriptional regulator PadR